MKFLMPTLLLVILAYSIYPMFSQAQTLPYPKDAEMANAKAGDIVINSGSLGDYKADFGILVVPENRSKENSKLIQLPVVRAHSKSSSPAEPIFRFEGGPGGTNIKPDSLPSWLLENHDYVMVSYRGVDGSVSIDLPEFHNVLKSVKELLSTKGLKEIGETMTQGVQALLYLSVYLDQFKRGWKYTAIYLLRDRIDEGGNQTYGFYRPDYTPKLSAIYIHNLTTILADNNSILTPGNLNYSIPNQPVTVHDMLLQKSDGKFELVVWNERLIGSDSVTVNLGATFSSVTIYDPTIGTSPIQNLSNVSSVVLTLSNHPVIIEILKDI